MILELTRESCEQEGVTRCRPQSAEAPDAAVGAAGLGTGTKG